MNEILLSKHNLGKFDSNGKIIILEFWSGDCNVCPQQKEVLLNIEKKAKNNLTIYGLNIDYQENYELAKSIGLSLLPSLLILKNKKRFILNGLQEESEIDYFITKRRYRRKTCVDCNKLNTKRKKGDKYFCMKNKIYVFIKDSC